MRIRHSTTVNAPRELVWDYINEPDNYKDFMEGITRWDVVGDLRSGLGARYKMLIRVGSAEVGGLIEVVEFKQRCDMAWASVTGVDQRGRWRLRDAGQGKTRVEFRYAYGVAGAGILGLISERVAAPSLSGKLKQSLISLKDQVEHERLRQEAALRREATSKP